jgi:hypothetical protein
MDWDEKYSGIQTKEHLDIPAELTWREEDSLTVFSPRLIIK